MYYDAAAAATVSHSLNEAANANVGGSDFATSIATSLQAAVAEHPSLGVTPTIQTDAVTPQAATATNEGGQVIVPSVVSSSL